MSERTKARWVVGILTTIALAFAGWQVRKNDVFGAEQARQAQEIKDMRELLTEVRNDVKELIRRTPGE